MDEFEEQIIADAKVDIVPGWDPIAVEGYIIGVESVMRKNGISLNMDEIRNELYEAFGIQEITADDIRTIGDILREDLYPDWAEAFAAYYEATHPEKFSEFTAMRMEIGDFFDYFCGTGFDDEDYQALAEFCRVNSSAHKEVLTLLRVNAHLEYMDSPERWDAFHIQRGIIDPIKKWLKGVFASNSESESKS